MKNRDQGSWLLIKGVDPYLPPALRTSTTLNLEDLIRARVLVAIMASALISTVCTMVILGIAHILSDDNFVNAMIIAAVGFVVLLLNYVFFYKSGRLDAAAILFSLSLFLATIVPIILTGGFDSPIRLLLLCTPIVAFLIGGRQEGIYNAALSFVVGLILLLLKVYDFPMMQIMSDGVLPYLAGLVWLLALILIVVCLYIYDVLLEDTRHTLARADGDMVSEDEKTTS